MRRSFDRLRHDRAALVVTVAAVLWFALLALDVWRRHDRFDTFDNDLGDRRGDAEVERRRAAIMARGRQQTAR